MSTVWIDGVVFIILLFNSWCLLRAEENVTTVNSEISTSGGKMSPEILKYLQKICFEKGTCVQNWTGIPAQYQTLEYRTCMCDADCALYRDCCSDSEYYHEWSSPSRENTTDVSSSQDQPAERSLQFECVPLIHGYNAYMVTKCPDQSTSTESSIITVTQEMIDKCHGVNASEYAPADSASSTPVSTDDGITYKNIFCAFCHHRVHFHFWRVIFAFEPTTEEDAHRPLTDKQMLKTRKLVYFNETNYSPPGYYITFRSTASVTTPINGTPPPSAPIQLHLFSDPQPQYRHLIRYCVPEMVTNCTTDDNSNASRPADTRLNECVDGAFYKSENCTKCKGLESKDDGATACVNRNSDDAKSPKYRFVASTILKVELRPLNQYLHCEDGSIPDNLLVHKTLCKVSCYSVNRETWQTCLLNTYYPLSAFDFVNESTIYLREYATYYTGPAEYTIDLSQSVRGEVYVCGSYISGTTWQRVKRLFSEWLNRILQFLSVICLVLHLALFQQLSELKNLSGRNLAAYCVTLLVSTTTQMLAPLFDPCRLPAILCHYSFLSCFCWMLLMAYDCWLSLYRATRKLRTVTSGKQRVRFAIYCFVGWSLPLTAVVPGVYMEFNESLGCGYGMRYGIPHESCFIGAAYWMWRLFVIPASCVFVTVVLLYASTAYILYTSQRDTVNPNARHGMRLYTRLALLMGMTWTFGTVVTFVPQISLLYDVANSSQGIAIFFAFTFKKKLLRSLVDKHPKSKLLSTTLSTYISSTSDKSDGGAGSRKASTSASSGAARRTSTTSENGAGDAARREHALSTKSIDTTISHVEIDSK